ncbi:MAG: energy transducer TonB [Gammaproteobacteria bacterium]|nr:energy transducer TonB [Gammaproteobacteria bacterium]MDE0253065.1 energy transducer TonB [Gammaproteobacteria bacterium]MDE0402291.1 energy transducer TonB [Gammaproteobacteria bacterium]
MRRLIERYCVGLCASTVVTISLFWGMQAVVSTEMNLVKDRCIHGDTFESWPTDIIHPEIAYIDTWPPGRLEIEKPRGIDEMLPKLEEPTRILETGSLIDTLLDVSAVGSVNADPRGYTVDGEYKPVYPRWKNGFELEGWVVVEFDVTETGHIENVVVVDAKPKRLFDDKAIKAAQKMRFRPKVVNGQPVRVKGVQIRIIFELENE